ncbi:hypothetical protein AHAS_Ahas14G0191600 [Arachis hypogaea]
MRNWSQAPERLVRSQKLAKRPRPGGTFQVDLTSDTVGDTYVLHTDANVKRVGSGGAEGRRCNDRPPAPDDVVNLGGLLSMKIMNLVFRSKDGMNLSGLELAVTTYIFSQDLPERYLTLSTGVRLATWRVHRHGPI